ncbi:hypothetical protein COV49_01145 [Candidatus Falkowbacteria bacterium CG11_big_fil_rev_8_21_14_0_20_39_10]|uniref:Glycosyltransferase 2-like domain-containing protein n=1 Tax=Candidatus Falkowbacteria bacterium CG11_big_fil_rev_8_21_14_0_20_39_10 TaxID=1974570 RepID=A0A2M6K9K8_9BACT|nr:MAG: hypothetical protein COV49_01145 [Candidatus Falkowbacteria bacterium CG11_big_fil_rev_8_21_14_0_20_39_10]
MKLSVTVILITLNDEKILPDCLDSIRRQKYSGKVKISIVDGGSFDDTVKIAKKYGADLLSRPDLIDSPQERAQIGIRSIQSDIAVFFSADNRFLEDSCLSEMVKPFENDKIAVVETFRYGFFPSSTLLTKYFALIGGADPIAVELGKADRAPFDVESWHSFGVAKNRNGYFDVKFKADPNKIPTLGANGVAIRNSLLKKYPIRDALHTEMCIEFIMKGYHVGFARNAHIVHEITSDLISFCKRRLHWATLYSSSNIRRTYNVFSFQNDFTKLLFIVISSITFVFPFARSLRGYFKYPHLAWFIHPFILFIFVVAYGIQVVSNFFRKIRGI